MNKKLSEYLYDTAPIFFDRKRIVLDQGKVEFEGVDINCGDGWYMPLEDFAEDVEALNVIGKKFGIYIRATQIKEKFGTLRIYFYVAPRISGFKNFLDRVLLKRLCRLSGYRYFLSGFGYKSKSQEIIIRFFTKIVDDLVAKCEKKCFDVCEQCGSYIGDDPVLRGNSKLKKVMTKGWIKYLCQNCADQNKSNYDFC